MKTTLAVRSAIRAFRRRPGFFAIAVTSLGIALGLSTAVFAMIDALQHPLAANEDVDRLVRIGVRGRYDPQLRRLSNDDLHDLIGASAFESRTVVAHRAGFAESDQRSQNRMIDRVAPNFLEVYGLRPALGRMFSNDDHERSDVIMVSDKVWRSHFSGLADLTNVTLVVDGRRYPIIGVLPPHAQCADILMPATENAIRTASNRRGHAVYSVTLRLRREHTIESMQPLLLAAESKFAALVGLPSSPLKFWLHSLRPEPITLEGFHFAMLGGAFAILLIACANVAALMLSRGVTSRRDYALHMALGARTSDLTRHVLAEVVLIGAAGALVGGVIAGWATQILTVSVPENFNNIGIPTPQWSIRVFGMALLATGTAVLIAAAGPAWYAAHTNPNEPLKESSGTTTGRSTSRFQFLVVAEIAMSMVLLFGASLMAKSTRQIANYDFGYDIRSIVTAQVYFPGAMTGQSSLRAEERRSTVQATLDRVRAMSGIDRASMFSYGKPDSNVIVSDRTAQGEPAFYTNDRWSYRAVGPEFFSVFGVRVTHGRDFLEGDRARGAVILSEGAAAILFPQGDGIGRLVRLGDDRSSRSWMPVVGIAPAIRFGMLDTLGTDAPLPDVFVFQTDSAPVSVSIVAHTSADPATVVVEMQRRLQDLTPAGSNVRTARWLQFFESGLKMSRYVGRLFTLLGLASLVLAAAGLFSVLSYVVSQRMREFAVRVALGAGRLDVVRLVVRNAMMMALGGTAIGAGVGMWAGFLIWNLLWGVYPVDAEALIIAEVTLVIATLAACTVPALRATRANPVDVMRAT